MAKQPSVNILPMPATTPTQPPVPQVQYQPPTALLSALNYLLDNPTVPVAFRHQFYIMWENVIFGNYGDKDVLFLMSKFREWCIMLKWFVPEQKWGNIITFQDTTEETPITIDLNILLNTLSQLYFINLTRGKDGFTVKEMTTMRSFIKSSSDDTLTQPKKTLRLF